MRTFRFSFLWLVLLSFGCGKERTDRQETDSPVTDTPDDTGTGGTARWLFLVYMAGDNDLESMVTKDLNELEITGSGDGVHVVVQADRAVGGSESDGDWTGVRRYYIEQDQDEHQVSSQVLQALGELDMGDPATLSDFLLWAREAYPAERVILSMWDHGDSWTMTADSETGAAPPYIISDDESGSEMSIAEGELHAALEAHVATWGPLDVIGFDACLMASWEVAHSLRDQALYMTASEEGLGMEGYPYEMVLDLLRRDQDLTSAEVAAEMARLTVEEGGEWTHSAMDLSQMDALAVAVDALAAAALNEPALQAPLLAARQEALGMWGGVWEVWYLDLYDLARLLAEGEQNALGIAAQDVEQAIESSVLAAYGMNAGPWNYTSAGGLSIFFAYDTDNSQALILYSHGAGATWAQATLWDDLLLQLAGGADSVR